MKIMDSNGNEVLDQFKQTLSKLKKRFLRKPNVTEACESFASLGQKCENTDLPAYAGLCWIAAAKCEGSLGNTTGETSCLIRSARQFALAEETDFKLGCVSPAGENVQSALSCYSHAVSRYPKNCAIPIGVNIEIADFLDKIGRKEYIDLFLNVAVDQSENMLDTKLYCLELLASNFIKSHDYVGALDAYKEITKILLSFPKKNGSRSDLLLKCEISTILLLLILKPTPQRLPPHLINLLEKYTWGDKNSNSNECKMSEKMFMLIQSLITTCQSLDKSSLVDLESELWPLLQKEQKELLRILVQIYNY